MKVWTYNSEVDSFGRSRGVLHFIYVTVIVLLLVMSTFHSTHFATDEENAPVGEGHTQPTFLSLVDPTSGDYLTPLEHTLYFLAWNSAAFLAPPNLTKSAQLLELDKTKISTVGDSLTVSWLRLSRDIQDDDVLTLFCDDVLLEIASISQAQATSLRHGGNSEFEWYIPYFPVTRHSSCQFWLYQKDSNSAIDEVQDIPATRALTNNQLDYQPISASHAIQVYTTGIPTQIHLALGDVPSTMVVHFVTGVTGTPWAVYRDKSNWTNRFKVKGTSHTYTAEQMCGPPANLTQTGLFQPPGQLQVINLTNLEPNTIYEYKVGLESKQGIMWSNVTEFTSPPALTAKELQEPFSYVVYADQGCAQGRWGDGGNWTAAMVDRELLHYNCRAIHHFGDLSYAKGASHVWDVWMQMIQPFASRMPFMIAIGNHVRPAWVNLYALVILDILVRFSSFPFSLFG